VLLSFTRFREHNTIREDGDLIDTVSDSIEIHRIRCPEPMIRHLRFRPDKIPINRLTRPLRHFIAPCRIQPYNHHHPHPITIDDIVCTAKLDEFRFIADVCAIDPPLERAIRSGNDPHRREVGIMDVARRAEHHTREQDEFDGFDIGDYTPRLEQRQLLNGWNAFPCDDATD